LVKDNYKINKDICKNCYNKEKRKCNEVSAKMSIYDEHIVKRTLFVGHRFSGKTYLMLKIHSRLLNQEIDIFTKSPPEHYFNSKIEYKQIGEEIEPLSEYEKAIIVFEDFLGSTNSRCIYQCSIKGRHNNLNIYYLSQSYFDLLKRTIQNNSNKIILFNQSLRDIENIYRDVAGYDMSYDEFKYLCRKSWEVD